MKSPRQSQRLTRSLRTVAALALASAALSAPGWAGPSYSVSATPTTALKSGSTVTVTVTGLAGSVGVYLSVCKAAATNAEVPSVCDQSTTQWVTAGTPGSATSPVSVTVQSAFEGKTSPSAPTTTSVDCVKESCVVYVRGDHNNRTDYSLIRVIPLTFTAGGKVRKADTATASYGTVTLQPNQAGQLAYRTPVYLNITTASGLNVTLSSLTPDCAVNGKVVTALKGTGVCAIAATTRGNISYSPLSVNFPFYLNPAVQTIKAAWPKPATKKVNGTMAIRTSAFKSSMEQPVILSTADAVCAVTTTSSGWTVRFLAKGNCTLTASAEGRQDKWLAASTTTTYTVQ